MLMKCVFLMQDGKGLPPNPENTGVSATPAAVSHGIEVAVEFKPVEHPIEPHDNDKPIQCPLPEPSILNVSSRIDLLTQFCQFCLVNYIFELRCCIYW